MTEKVLGMWVSIIFVYTSYNKILDIKKDKKKRKPCLSHFQANSVCHAEEAHFLAQLSVSDDNNQMK